MKGKSNISSGINRLQKKAFGAKKQGSRMNSSFPDCDPARARTEDPKIKSLLLYQLSYGVKI